MVNGLAVSAGRGRHRSRSRDARQPYFDDVARGDRVKLNGKLKEGVTATDLVLTVTQMLRRAAWSASSSNSRPGLANLTIADLPPSATCRRNTAPPALLPGRRRYAQISARHRRPAERVALVAAYAKAQGMYRTKTTPDPLFTDVLKLELASVEPSLAGPKRPQDRIALKEVKNGSRCRWRRNSQGRHGGKQIFDLHPSLATSLDKDSQGGHARRLPVEGRTHDLGHGDVVIAAITSCTNTSNPSVMVARACLRARQVAKGLTSSRGSRPRWRGLAGWSLNSRQVGAAEGPRQARLQSRWFRLHHLHR